MLVATSIWFNVAHPLAGFRASAKSQVGI